MIRSLLWLPFLLLFFSCEKNSESIWKESTLEDRTGIRDFYYDNTTNTLIGVGGNVWEKGVLFKTSDSDNSWSLDSISANELNFILKKENGWMMTGLYGSLIEADDTFENINTHNAQLQAYTSVSIVDSVVIVSGYDGFTQGYIDIFEFHKGISERQTYNQSIRTMHYSSGRKKHFAGGYGIGFTGDNRMNNIEIIEAVNNEQIEKILEDKYGAVYLFGYSGKVYVSESENHEWKTYNVASSLFRNTAIRTACILDNGHILVAGERGNVFLSTNSGKKWKKLDAPDEEYVGIGQTANFVFFSTRSGKMFRIAIENL